MNLSKRVKINNLIFIHALFIHSVFIYYTVMTKFSDKHLIRIKLISEMKCSIDLQFHFPSPKNTRAKISQTQGGKFLSFTAGDFPLICHVSCR